MAFQDHDEDCMAKWSGVDEGIYRAHGCPRCTCKDVYSEIRDKIYDAMAPFVPRRYLMGESTTVNKHKIAKIRAGIEMARIGMKVHPNPTGEQFMNDMESLCNHCDAGDVLIGKLLEELEASFEGDLDAAKLMAEARERLELEPLAVKV